MLYNDSVTVTCIEIDTVICIDSVIVHFRFYIASVFIVFPTLCTAAVSDGDD